MMMIFVDNNSDKDNDFQTIMIFQTMHIVGPFISEKIWIFWHIVIYMYTVGS